MAEATERFQELERALAEAEALLADEANSLPHLQEELTEARRQVGSVLSIERLIQSMRVSHVWRSIPRIATGPAQLSGNRLASH